MKCPHCTTEIHAEDKISVLGKDAEGGWAVNCVLCPACKKFIIYLQRGKIGATIGRHPEIYSINKTILVRPKGTTRPPPPIEVPKDFSEDYLEACLVLSDSAKASAALSRRCLQHLLRESAKVRHADLNSEIQEVLDSGKLPSHIADSIDAVRNIGNFAAHPIKSKSTGEIVPVEIGEAEWNLDLLESLFDYYFVQPAKTAKRKAALNTKLKDSGKNPMK